MNAPRRHTLNMPRIDSLEVRLAEMKKRDNAFQDKYGCDYETFCKRIALDEAYLKEVEVKISKLWENDQADWEFCHKGTGDWESHIQKRKQQEKNEKKDQP